MIQPGLIITLRSLDTLSVSSDYPVIQNPDPGVVQIATLFATPGERDKFILELSKRIPRSISLDMSLKK